METWRFLYTSHNCIRQATTKTGALKEGNASKTHFIVTDGSNYSECLQKAKKECSFNDSQLIGSREIK